jgi:hypothetical protein
MILILKARAGAASSAHLWKILPLKKKFKKKLDFLIDLCYNNYREKEREV